MMNQASHGAGPRNERQKRKIISRSPGETEKLGFEIAAELEAPCVVLLRGALGTGKTTLARGIALGLGVEDGSLVSSPSFTLVNIYHGLCTVYHVDLYRLEKERDFQSVGLDEFLGTDGVTVVEWGERLTAAPGATLVVELRDAGNDTRIIEIWKPTQNRAKPERQGKERPLIGIPKRRTATGTKRRRL